MRKADMKRKYMNTDKAQWKKPELTPLINEVGGGTNMQSKQARVLQYKAWSKTRVNPKWWYRHCWHMI